MEYLCTAEKGEFQNISDKTSDPTMQNLNSKHICQMDYLEELRSYSQGAKYEIETKLEMKQWEKKAAGNCKVLKEKTKQNKTDPTWCLVRYDGDG